MTNVIQSEIRHALASNREDFDKGRGVLDDKYRELPAGSAARHPPRRAPDGPRNNSRQRGCPG